jgi:glycerol-3-phosphate dehydrogenase (NAD(P)+)
MTRCAVLGTGSWGTAFAMVLAEAGASVRLWGRRAELVAQINQEHCNQDYLPSTILPSSIVATTDPAAALAEAEFVVLAIPAQSLRESLLGWRHLLPANAILVSLMKGVELGTTLRMSQVIAEVTGAEPERIAVLSGPNLAGEIARRQPTASVVACVDQQAAARFSRACATGYFRPYTGQDVVGTELGGAVKNVIALAVGMAAGLELGDNTKATVMTRGLAEATRLGVALGADPQTFSGLAGVGDLLATCMSALSRNRSFGEQLGRGSTVAEVVAATRQVAEGVKSCRSILQLGQDHGVELPITQAVVSVVHEGMPVAQMRDRLLARALRAERD